MTKRTVLYIGAILILIVATSAYLYLKLHKNATNPTVNQVTQNNPPIDSVSFLKNDFPFYDEKDSNTNENALTVDRDTRLDYSNNYNIIGTGDFIIKNTLSDKEIARVPFSSFKKAMLRDFGSDEKITEDLGVGFIGWQIATSKPQMLYVLFSSESQSASKNLNRTDLPIHLYSANYDGSDFKEIYSYKGDCASDMMLIAPDQHSVVLVDYTKSISAKDPFKINYLGLDPRLTILDLPSGKLVASFLIPGDIAKFVSESGLDKINPKYGVVRNIIGAWLINTDGSVDFSRYYGLDPLITVGAIPKSDKEIWHFDPTTKKLTLIKTIPLGKYTVR